MIYLKTSVGIELRGEDMLISSLQSNLSGGVFTHFLRIPGYRLREKADLQKEIDFFFKSNGISRENIVLGIPRHDVVLRYLNLPSEVADNLKQVVHYQVQSYEPVEGERYYYDYVRIDKGEEEDGKKLTVLIAMVRKTTLDELLTLLRSVGVRPMTVTCSSIGLANIFLHNRRIVENKTFVIGDLGALSMELLVLRDGSLVYSREVAREKEVEWKELLLREIDEALSAIRLDQEATLEKIILAGESSDAVRDEMMTVTTDCELVKSYMDVDVPTQNLSRIQEAAASLGLAYTGLVRRHSMKLNLLPPEHRIHQSRWGYVPAAVLGTAIVLLLCGLAFHNIAQDRRLADRLDREIQQLAPSVKRVESLRSQTEEMEKRIKAVEALVNNRDANLEILKELTTILPSDTFLNTYQYRNGTIQLGGLSNSASDLVPRLENSPLLKDVVFRGGILKDVPTGKERFNIEAKLER